MRKNFNIKEEVNRVIEFIKEQVGDKKAVIAISGGKDSTVAGALLVEALGKDNVIGVMLPNGVQKDISDSEAVIKHLSIKGLNVNISDAYNGIIDSIMDNGIPLSNQSVVNIAPRIRMTTVYAIAQTVGGRVCGTGNKSEAYVGFFTKYGDGGVDFNPLANFDTEEVMTIGDYLELPHELVHKTPSDGLTGKSDEESLGFTYEQLNRYINEGTSGVYRVDKIIEEKHGNSLHKLAMPKTINDDLIYLSSAVGCHTHNSPRF